METFIIGTNTLEYDDDTHTYIVDGVIVPSITQMLSVKFGNKYAGINKATLERAANRGTRIHKAIENFCKTWEEDGTKEVHNFKFLAEYHALNPHANEIPIIIKRNGKPIAAGRLDIVGDINGDTFIADIKTTSVLDKEYLAYQLNLYRIGYTQIHRANVKHLYGIHLKDDKRKLVNIPVNEALAWEIVDKYERVNK